MQQATKRAMKPPATANVYWDMEISFDPIIKKNFVVGAAANVSNGDVLTWEAKGTDVTITFPRIGGAKVVDPESINIQEGNKGSMRVVLADFDGTKSYYNNKYNKTGLEIEVPYSVYCAKNNQYAEGGSDPKIIVKGP